MSTADLTQYGKLAEAECAVVVNIHATNTKFSGTGIRPRDLCRESQCSDHYTKENRMLCLTILPIPKARVQTHYGLNF